MARKNVLKSYKMLDQADMSTSLESEPTSVINLDKASIVLSWTGSPVGTFSLEARNGVDEAWYALDFGATIEPGGSAGNHRLLLTETPFTDVRLIYAATSGSGTLNAVITAKQVGG